MPSNCTLIVHVDSFFDTCNLQKFGATEISSYYCIENWDQYLLFQGNQKLDHCKCCQDRVHLVQGLSVIDEQAI